MEAENAEPAPKTDSLWLLKSIFSKKISGDGGGDAGASPKDNPPLPFLSPQANSVVAACSK